MALTQEDLNKLMAPLPLESGHEVRVQQELQDGKRAMWLVYTTELPVRARLTEVDPGWSMRHVGEIVLDNYVAITVELTVCGTTRTGTGGRDGKSKDTALGAATDALKRAARNFEIGSYLLEDKLAIYTDYAPKPKQGATTEQWNQYRKVIADAEKDAFAQFTRWYNKHFGGKPTAPASQPDPSRAIGRDVPVTPIAETPVTRAERSTADEPEQREAAHETPVIAIEHAAIVDRARRTYPFDKDEATKGMLWKDYIKGHASYTKKLWPAVKALGLTNDGVHNGLHIPSVTDFEGTVAGLWFEIVKMAPAEQQELRPTGS